MSVLTLPPKRGRGNPTELRIAHEQGLPPFADLILEIRSYTRFRPVSARMAVLP